MLAQVTPKPEQRIMAVSEGFFKPSLHAPWKKKKEKTKKNKASKSMPTLTVYHST